MTAIADPELKKLFNAAMQGSSWNRSAFIAALNARLAAADAMAEALQGLHDDNAEYARINHLGGYENHWMVRARSALAAYRAAQPKPQGE